MDKFEKMFETFKKGEIPEGFFPCNVKVEPWGNWGYNWTRLPKYCTLCKVDEMFVEFFYINPKGEDSFVVRVFHPAFSKLFGKKAPARISLYYTAEDALASGETRRNNREALNNWEIHDAAESIVADLDLDYEWVRENKEDPA